MNFNWTFLWFPSSTWTWKKYHEIIKIDIHNYFSAKIVKNSGILLIIKPFDKVLYLQQNAILKKSLNDKIVFQNKYI